MTVTQLVSKISQHFGTHPSLLMRSPPRENKEELSATLNMEAIKLNIPQISGPRLLLILLCCEGRCVNTIRKMIRYNTNRKFDTTSLQFTTSCDTSMSVVDVLSHTFIKPTLALIVVAQIGCLTFVSLNWILF